MRTLFAAIIGIMTMVAAPLSSAVAAEAAGSVYIVAHCEAAAPDVAKVAGELRQQALASRQQPGNIGFTVLQEIGRPSRFAVFEGWRDAAALEAQRTSPGNAAFRDKLNPLLVGPLEIREHHGFSLATPHAKSSAEAVYVVTHVDVFPAGKDQAAALVTALAEANRKLPGNLMFDVLQVEGHPNHFTLVQPWRDRKAFDDSLMAASTRDFRQKITPLEGALYDERLYAALRSEERRVGKEC